MTDGGSGVIGNNLFIYGANNPVNNLDPSGNGIIKSAIKWLTKNVVKPVVKKIQKSLSKKNLTYSRGINISATPSVFMFSFQGGMSMDTKGNVAIQTTYSSGITGGTPGISCTGYKTVTNASSIDGLNGMGYQIGGSAGIPVMGVPLAVGSEVNIIPQSVPNKYYYGLTRNMGFGIPGYELHVEWGDTQTMGKLRFNVFDVAENVYVKIMEW